MNAQISAEAFPSFLPCEVDEIKEPAALSMLRNLKRVDVKFSDCPEGAPSSFYGENFREAKGPAVVLLHGFDSSCLEFRRLVPALEADHGIQPVALDVLGWGFTDTRKCATTSAAAKRRHLHAFWQQELGGRPMVLVGASLGGAIALDFAAAFPEAVEKMVLIDAQVV